MPDAAPPVDAALLDALMTEVSRFGATPEGGLNRPALTAEHGQARDWLCATLRERGYAVSVDAIGNVFGVLDLAGPDAPLIMSGSHLDSQPMGGRFDGAYGVVAALAAIEAVRARLDPGAARCNFAVADWMNEEGARFQPSLLGSGVFGGEHTLDFALARRDGAGLTVAEELARTGYRGADAAPDPSAYIEMHIECGPELEKAGRAIGPFARYWGALKIRAAMIGEQAHTGPTAMALRRDALLGAAYVIAGLREMADTASGTLYTSVGRLEVTPNSPNIVPGRATMFIELRSPEPETLAAAEAALERLLPTAAAKAGIGFEVISIDRRPAGRFDPRLVDLAETEAAALGLSTMRLDTIGGHDAIPVGRRCPAIVVAVPCRGGVCHNAAEFAEAADLLNGANVLAGMLWRVNAAGGALDAA
ncbi:MAG: Zn-dependent hydrolase [Rhodobacteraceae bacterium]|nr:MAG: Zn-dependent hydrolase [Paracoccaceae bacterium]